MVKVVLHERGDSGVDAVAKTLAKYKTKLGRERLGNVMKNVGGGKFIKEVLASV
jgi:coenzyme F420 hydrogenase subunit beta